MVLCCLIFFGIAVISNCYAYELSKNFHPYFLIGKELKKEYKFTDEEGESVESQKARHSWHSIVKIGFIQDITTHYALEVSLKGFHDTYEKEEWEEEGDPLFL